jgi:hypothetical protein
MQTRHVLLKLRVATANDFKTATGEKKIGVAFFKQSATGVIENKICYTDADFQNNKIAIEEFKELFNCGQVWVMENNTEPISIFNCIDWHIIDKELDHELEQLEKLKKTA